MLSQSELLIPFPKSVNCKYLSTVKLHFERNILKLKTNIGPNRDLQNCSGVVTNTQV